MAATSSSSPAGPSNSNTNGAHSSSSNQPNTSLYIKNLNTKTKKPELRRQLYALFSTYGKVIDVVATRAEGMIGQAFVVFRDLSSATAARRALDGFEFYEKSIRIEYASKPSKASIVAEHGPEALFDPTIMQAVGLAPASSSNRLTKVTTSSAQADQKGRERKRQREEARQRGETVDSSGGEEEEDEEEEDEGPETKIRKVESASEEPIAHSEATSKPVAADEVKEQVQEEEGEEEDEEGGAMDMEDSDDDD